MLLLKPPSRPLVSLWETSVEVALAAEDLFGADGSEDHHPLKEGFIPNAAGLRTSRASPSEEWWPTPSFGVPMSPLHPQETGLPTPPPLVFWGTAVSSELLFQSLHWNVAELGGSLSPRRMFGCSCQDSVTLVCLFLVWLQSSVTPFFLSLWACASEFSRAICSFVHMGCFVSGAWCSDPGTSV